MSKAVNKGVQKPDDLSLQAIAGSLVKEYNKTSVHLKILDLYCASALCTALVQFVYAFVVGTFPFNAFLAGFFCCVGSFVLTLSMRMQLSGKEGAKTSRERAFLNYTFAMTMLFLAVWCYIG